MSLLKNYFPNVFIIYFFFFLNPPPPPRAICTKYQGYLYQIPGLSVPDTRAICTRYQACLSE